MKAIRNLGLAAITALVFAAFAGVAPASASPAGFVAGSYPGGGVTLKGVDAGHHLTFSRFNMFGTFIHCRPPSFRSTTQTGPSSTIQVDEHESTGVCWSTGGVERQMQWNGCELTTFKATDEEGLFNGTVGIGPPGCGPIKVENAFWGCDIAIEPSASFAGLVNFLQAGEAVEATTELRNFKVTKSGTGESCVGSTESATWYPDWMVQAWNQAGASVSLKFVTDLPFGFFLNGKKFEAESYPRAVSGEGFAFTAAGATTTCEESSISDSIPSSTEQLTLDATYAKCKTNVPFLPSATVDMKSCYYTLTGGGVFGIACSKEGDKIEYKAYDSGGALYCTLQVGPQSGLSSVSLENVGSGVDRGVSLNAKVEGIQWVKSGTCGAGSGSGGKLTGESTLMGVG